MGSKLIEKPAGYLEGQLIIATPQLVGSCFARSVIYVFAHDEDGAMGLVINHIFDNLNYSHVFDQLSIKHTEALPNIPVHFGGPIDSERGFILHSNDIPHSAPLKENFDIALSSNISLLQDIAQGKGPKHALLALGYAGWSPGQLEKEMENNSWVEVPATQDIIFSKNHHSKWLETAQSYGIDLYRLSPGVGHA